MSVTELSGRHQSGSMRSQPAMLCVLLDIEGTTTPIDFVEKTLFPFARRHAREYLESHGSDELVIRDLEALRSQHTADVMQGLNPPPWPGPSEPRQLEPAITYITWLMDHDRKATPLKSLQGLIWEQGYVSGALRGEVYPDVPRAFARWRSRGKTIAIFSSGSVLAQKLLFRYSTLGDLSSFIQAHFDTSTGPKKEAQSYVRIAQALNISPSDILFASDVAAELDAARAAGMQAVLCIRGGFPESPAENLHHIISSFDDIPP